MQIGVADYDGWTDRQANRRGAEFEDIIMLCGLTVGHGVAGRAKRAYTAHLAVESSSVFTLLLLWSWPQCSMIHSKCVIFHAISGCSSDDQGISD